MKLVTSYPSPDLDGAACLMAYSEFLERNGEDVIGAVFGEPDKEARFLINKFDIAVLDAKEYLENSEVVIVDASFPDGISDQIELERVVEVIDHRKNNDANSFPNAKIDIQLVGAAATLVVERFKEQNLQISKESANLLYAAIKDNTVNFEANVTTERDRKAAKWLKENAEINFEACQKIFEIKSKENPEPREIVPDDYYTTTIGDKKVGVSQFESLHAEKFVTNNLEDIKQVLMDLKQKQNLDYAFLTTVDIELVNNYIVAADSETIQILSSALGLEFENNLAVNEEIMLRKEIMPKVRDEIS